MLTTYGPELLPWLDILSAIVVWAAAFVCIKLFAWCAEKIQRADDTSLLRLIAGFTIAFFCSTLLMIGLGFFVKGVMEMLLD